MSWTTERTAIEGRLSGWTTTPIRYENIAFQQPASPYLAVYIRNGQSEKASLGLAQQLRRHLGVVFVQIIGTENDGMAALRTYADTVAALFRDVSLTLSVTEWIQFYEPSIAEITPVNGRPQINVTIPFDRDEIL